MAPMRCYRCGRAMCLSHQNLGSCLSASCINEHLARAAAVRAQSTAASEARADGIRALAETTSDPIHFALISCRGNHLGSDGNAVVPSTSAQYHYNEQVYKSVIDVGKEPNAESIAAWFAERAAAAGAPPDTKLKTTLHLATGRNNVRTRAQAAEVSPRTLNNSYKTRVKQKRVWIFPYGTTRVGENWIPHHAWVGEDGSFGFSVSLQRGGFEMSARNPIVGATGYSRGQNPFAEFGRVISPDLNANFNRHARGRMCQILSL